MECAVTHNVILRTEGPRPVSILEFTNDYLNNNLVYFAINVVFSHESKTAYDYSYTIKDLALYEGEFKNPPVTTSLDVKPGNRFAFRDNLNNNYRFSTTITSEKLSHWVRLCPISCGVTHNAGRIFLLKGYTPLQDSSLLLDFACNNVTNNDGKAYGYIRIVSAIARGTPTGNKWPLFITKLRIAKPANDSPVLYLEGMIGDNSSYMQNSNFNMLLLNNSNAKESINAYYGGSEYYYNAFKGRIIDELYQIADNDVAISDEISTPSTNGFIS